MGYHGVSLEGVNPQPLSMTSPLLADKFGVVVDVECKKEESPLVTTAVMTAGYHQ